MANAANLFEDCARTTPRNQLDKHRDLAEAAGKLIAALEKFEV